MRVLRRGARVDRDGLFQHVYLQQERRLPALFGVVAAEKRKGRGGNPRRRCEDDVRAAVLPEERLHRYRPDQVVLQSSALNPSRSVTHPQTHSLSLLAASTGIREVKRPLGAPTPHGEGCSFRSFTTDCYKLHYLDSPSGIKIVLNTSKDVGSLEKQMWVIYSSLYCEYIVKNPLYTVGEPFECEQFVQKLNKFVATLG